MDTAGSGVEKPGEPTQPQSAESPLGQVPPGGPTEGWSHAAPPQGWPQQPAPPYGWPPQPETQPGGINPGMIVALVAVVFLVLFVVPIVALILLSGPIYTILSNVGNGL